MKKPSGKPGKRSEPKGKKNQKRVSQIPAKNKSNVVKYGSLSRKQKDHLHEYGELDPAGQEAENDADEINNDLSEFIAKKRRRIVTEKEMDADEPVEEDEDVQQPSGINDNKSWFKPSAYGKLVKLLQKTSNNKAFYERRKIEEEGLEDLDEDEEEEEEDEEKVLELTEEEAKLYREKYGDDAVVDVAEKENDLGNDSSEDKDDEDNEESDGEQEAVIEEDETYDSEQSDDENLANSQDEFELHFGDRSAIALTEQANLVDQRQWKTTSFEDNAVHTVILSECGTATDVVDEKKRRSLLEKADLDQWKIKKRMHETWQKVNSPCIGKGSSRPFTSLQTSLFSHINKYRDLLFSDRNNENASSIINTYCLHALNHVLKTRDRVLKNSAKIAQLQSQDKDVSEIRDQGFTRPKVLILVPFRNSAKKVVETLIRLSGSEQVEKRKRFYDEFSAEEKEDEDSNDPSKPADYNATFSGNVDDHFRVGIKFTRKTIKLYSDFYASDVLVASPLGLRMIIGAEGDKKRDYDFLSSIELVVLDQCDTFLMQNWDHMESVFSHLNLIPKQAHDCDFSRVRNWYLDGKARYLRQTLIFSEFLTPEINSLFNSEMKNLAGKVKSKRTYEGSIVDVIPQVKQVFTRLECPSFSEVDNLRFQHFTGKTLTALRHSSVSQSHTCIVIPSYFDFVRVRNYFMENEINFGQLSEYTTRADISRARSDFFHGRRPFLLVTERFHFFRRYRLRGIRRLIFYAPPDHPQFYSEFVNFLALPAVSTSRKDTPITNEDLNDSNAVAGVVGTLYSKFDLLRMERIVGSSRVSKMCKGDKGVYLFA